MGGEEEEEEEERASKQGGVQWRSQLESVTISNCLEDDLLLDLYSLVDNAPRIDYFLQLRSHTVMSPTPALSPIGARRSHVETFGRCALLFLGAFHRRVEIYFFLTLLVY